MAHEVETMAYAGDTPWHGLGKEVHNDLTPAQMLVEAGLVRRERRGTWAWYSLVPDRIAEIGALFC